MIISILNCDIKWGIGRKNGLLFVLPEDMKFFKNTTYNHVVCMGENTLLSFPNCKPLKNRLNIVLSSNSTHNYDNVINVHSLDEFLKTIKEYEKKDYVFIIGGASIYNQTLKYVDYVYLTKVFSDGHAEVFFENLDENENFVVEKEHKIIQDGEHKTQLIIYKNLHKEEIV